MTAIELVIVLLVTFMVVPDLASRARRPALSYVTFVAIGIGLGPIVDPAVRTMIQEVGSVGFLLLLFEVGLDIDLPSVREIGAALGGAVRWLGVNAAAALGAATLLGFGLGEAANAAFALSACSVGMAYAAWRTFPADGAQDRRRTLHVMVIVELFAMILLTVWSSLAHGRGAGWLAAATVAGAVLAIVVIGLSARHLTRLFERVLTRTSHWRVHTIVLMVLVVAAAGNRLGLSAPKAAFFLGLFMAHVEHDGRRLEDYLAPVSRRLLIPTCFVGLGTSVEWSVLGSWIAPAAAGTALALLLLRWGLQHTSWRSASAPRAFLLLSPNLTVVALAASMLLHVDPASVAARWLLLTGVLVTVPAILLLPATPLVPSAAADDDALAGAASGLAPS